jgi:predicted enzyme related to lactoylglutathione lyase
LGLDPDDSGIKNGNHTTAYWSVDNIEDAVKKATALKARIVTPIANVGGTIETAVVEDPFGNWIGLISGA